MTTQTKPKVSTTVEVRTPKAKITRDHVARYLRTHSDFFTHHVDLIETLAIPHETGVAVSLVERQVELLRNKNKELDQKLHQLIKIAKDNEKVSSRLHTISLGLVSIRGFDEALSGIHDLMHADFPGTKVNIRLFDVLQETTVKDCQAMEKSLQKSKLVQDLFSSRRRGVAFLTKRQIENVFDKEKQGKPIRSAAAVALKKSDQLGVLFLGNLGEILGAKLQQFTPAVV
jgi:uncharacterized protein YigA (DUF484 family)